MIKLIIFDVGGVIDTFDETLYIAYISKKLSIDALEFKNTLIPLLDKLEVGKITLKYMKKALAKRFNLTQNQLEWESAFTKLNSVNQDVVKLISRLSKNYRIAILTNVSRSRHLMKMERYLEKVKYDKIFASCYLKIAKPNPRIYKLVLKAMNVKPDEAIFVDNLKRNTNGAERAGIKSIQFINYKQLSNSMNKIGIK